eukprot:CFRG6208T1
MASFVRSMRMYYSPTSRAEQRANTVDPVKKITTQLHTVYRRLRNRIVLVIFFFACLFAGLNFIAVDNTHNVDSREMIALDAWHQPLNAEQRMAVGSPTPAPCHQVDDDLRLNRRPMMENGKTLKKAVGALAVDNMIIVTFASDSQRILLRNFACSMQRHHNNWMVIAFDNITATDVTSHFGPSHVYFDRELLGMDMISDYDASAKNKSLVWRNLMHVKLSTVRAILELGYDVMIADADTSLLRSITKTVNLYNKCDFQFQPDYKSFFSYDEYRGVEGFNCGVYFVRSSVHVLHFYKVWLEAFNCEEGFREQRALFTALKLLQKYKDYYVYDPRTNAPFYYETDLDPSLLQSFAERLNSHVKDQEDEVGDSVNVVDIGMSKSAIQPTGVRMCYFDPQDFPNGGIYFMQNKQYRRRYGASAPIMLHTNYMKSKVYRKIDAFKQVGAWFMDKQLRCTEQPTRDLHEQ